MPARTEKRREGRRARSLLPVFLSVLIVLPSNPFVVSAAAQAVDAAEGASTRGSVGGFGAAAAGNSAAAPAPLALSAQAFAAPLTAAAPAPTAGKSASGGALSGLRRTFFGNGAAAERNADGTLDGSPQKKALDAGGLAVVLMRPGKKPVTTTLSRLRETLDAGDYASFFDGKSGHLRVVLADGGRGGAALSESDVPMVQDAVRNAGLQIEEKRTRIEAIHVSEPAGTPGVPADAARPGAAKPKAGAAQYVVRGAVAAAVIGTGLAVFGATNILGMVMLAGAVSNIDRIVRETAYSATMLKAALRESKRPGWTEVVGGLLSKVLPALVNIGVFATMYHGHPVALTASVALSLIVETFHGVWVNAWDTFQSKIGRHRGPLFQNLFNFFYGQLISGSYRLIAFFALAMAPPWSLAYWKPMIVMTVIGTFCGTLGYRGLNSLYEKGRIPRKGRAGIQQGRDLLMMLVGPFFSTGNMFASWLIFFAQQSIDLGIYAVDRRTRSRPIVYVADAAVARSDDFHRIYLDEKSSAVKDALEGVKGFILVKPFVALGRWIGARLSRSRSKPPSEASR